MEFLTRPRFASWMPCLLAPELPIMERTRPPKRFKSDGRRPGFQIEVLSISPELEHGIAEEQPTSNSRAPHTVTTIFPICSLDSM
jgi:hypothetical protein